MSPISEPPSDSTSMCAAEAGTRDPRLPCRAKGATLLYRQLAPQVWPRTGSPALALRGRLMSRSRGGPVTEAGKVKAEATKTAAEAVGTGCGGERGGRPLPPRLAVAEEEDAKAGTGQKENWLWMGSARLWPLGGTQPRSSGLYVRVWMRVWLITRELRSLAEWWREGDGRVGGSGVRKDDGGKAAACEKAEGWGPCSSATCK